MMSLCISFFGICLLLLVSEISAFQPSNTLSTARSRLANPAAMLRHQTSHRFNTQLNASSKDKDARQLLGIKGASESSNIWAIRLQLLKPVTWIPLLWGVACGAAASGNYHTWNPFSSDPPLDLVAEDALKAFVCMILAGPLLTGYTQTLNDWEDREIDAINEPYRPIPSGK